MSTAQTAEAMEFQPGAVLLGKYRVNGTLGIGGMGTVILATHLELQDHVAIKFLLPHLASEETAERFLREARAAARIKSPHVTRVLDVGKIESGLPYIVMEYLAGRDLGDLIETDGPCSVEMAAALGLQACEALAAAHSAGIVHRDVKPSNLFVTQAEDGAIVLKMLDFGISKAEATMEPAALTNATATLGSPLYMSPEQIRSARSVDFRTDIWSLGVVLYEAVTGQVPFVSDTMTELIALVLETSPRPIAPANPDIPEEFRAVILRCLEKSPTARFQNMAELAGALAPFCAGGSESAARTVRILARSTLDKSDPAMSGNRRFKLPGSLASSEPLIRKDTGARSMSRSAATPNLFQPPRRSRSAAVAMGGGVLLAGAVIAAAALYSLGAARAHRGQAATAAPASGAVAGAASAPPGTAEVSSAPSGAPEKPVLVRLSAVPATALLSLDGARLNGNPFASTMASDRVPHVVLAEAPGFQSQSRAVSFEHDVDVRLELVRDPPSAFNERGRRSARPALGKESPSAPPPQTSTAPPTEPTGPVRPRRDLGGDDPWAH